MKKLTKEEAEKIPVQGKGRSSAVSSALQAMKVGEIVLLARMEWSWKRGPSIICKRLEKKMGLVFTCKRVMDGSGWIIKRIK